MVILLYGNSCMTDLDFRIVLKGKFLFYITKINFVILENPYNKYKFYLPSFLQSRNNTNTPKGLSQVFLFCH